jgi:predicted chitinase
MRKFNVDTALELSGYNGKFKQSLKGILNRLSKDSAITDLRVAAYILATAKVESDYSLQRWEADYLCGEMGVPYQDQPCQRALNYYASTNGKQNYYNLGVDSKGLPYFGRGGIQLTGVANYDKYGQKIGVNLLKDADKALIPDNSYNIMVAYINDRTKKYILANDWYGARRSVNGCSSCDLSKVQPAYDMWLNILTQARSVQYEKNKKMKVLISILVLTAVMGGTVFIIFRLAEKK